MSALPCAHRRLTIWPSRAISLGVALAVLTLASATAAGPADREIAKGPEPAVERALIASGSGVEGGQPGPGAEARMARGQLDALLRQKIESTDLICELTDDQKQKLLIAGRGDIERLIDRCAE